MSNTLKTFFVIAFIGFNFNVWSQDVEESILMEIGDRKVTVAEFEAVYKKNNPEVSQQGLEEYLDLYVNFRLKVKDAESMGLDTLDKFKKELAGYRKQLAEPYLSDNEVTEALIKEAYDRMKWEVKASHILINVGPNAKPADTLVAFRKIDALKNRIEKGEDFGKVARESSDDPSARENFGGLGYFSALYMLYSFETAVYNLEVGQVAGPIRTQYGYHLIKLEDKRPNRGEITVAHIMTRIPREANEADIEASKMKIDEIYDKLKEGANFEQMAAQFSDDKPSAQREGVLPPFTAGRMVPEFEEAAFALEKDGDFSKPIKTKYGFHIIKRIKVKPLGSFEEVQPELKVKIARDSRSRKSKVAFLDRVKKEYGFKENLARRNEFYKAIDTTYFQKAWSPEKVAKLNKEIFRIGDKVVYQQDFAKYLAANQPRGKVADVPAFIDRSYQTFSEDYITNYEDARLEGKYPEFKMLMQEYHDGILLFDLTDEKVWSKAVKDSAGLAAFYEAHKTENMWGERLEAVVYNAADAATAKAVKKNIKSRVKNGYTDEDILKMANGTSQLNLELERGKYSKGDNGLVDQIPWKKGVSSDIAKDNRVYFIEVIGILPAQPKELNEIKGLMTSAYQDSLEKQWLAELKSKYDVKVYKENLTKIK